MTNNLLSLVNTKNHIYSIEIGNQQTMLMSIKRRELTFEKIVDQNIIDAKYFYYHNIFLTKR